MGVWALDTKGTLAIRREINSTFPEGSHWQFLANIENDPPHTDGYVGFKHVSVGDEVWAVSLSGLVCRRCGISDDNVLGNGWNIGIAVSTFFFISSIQNYDLILRNTLLTYIQNFRNYSNKR